MPTEVNSRTGIATDKTEFMMLRKITAPWIAAVAVFFALPTIAHANPPPVILDSWWDVDYANISCRNMHIPECNDPVREVKTFESQLITQFAGRQICRGIRIEVFKNPTRNPNAGASADMAKGKIWWALSLDFVPGEKSQDWKMSLGPEDTVIRQGHGTPSEIAENICVIVKNQGAEIAH